MILQQTSYHTMTSPNHIEDARISALAEEAFQWLIGLANIPEDAIIPDVHVTSMVPDYEGDHTLLLQTPLAATVSGRSHCKSGH